METEWVAAVKARDFLWECHLLSEAIGDYAGSWRYRVAWTRANVTLYIRWPIV
jgi:hypothetical protein